MKLNYLIGTVSVAITTTAVAITVPELYKGASALLIGAQVSNSPIPWRRQRSINSAVSKLCPEQDIVLSLNLSKDTTLFYAKTLTGTGTLEIEFWR
jgi:hypothetical protein